MDFRLSEEQTMLRDGVARYLSQHYGFEQRREVLKSPTRCSDVHWAAFAELGWLALPLPEDAGGLGGSFVDVAILMEAFGRHLVLEPYATTTILGARLLARSDQAAIHAARMGRIIEGSLRLALAHEEPGRRAPAREIETRARRDGETYVLDGTKFMAFDAPAAAEYLVTAIEGGARGYSLFLVPATASGLRVESYPLIDGTLAADVLLSGVRIDAAQRICGPDSAAAVLDEALDRLTLARVAEALGSMEAVMDLTAEHIRNRQQFGQPLAKFQALQHRMAEMFVEVQETRSILYYGLANIDTEPARRAAAVSAAKTVAVNAARVVGGQGIQLHGGVGMTDEYAVSHHFKRLLALEKAHGDADHHLARLAAASRA